MTEEEYKAQQAAALAALQGDQGDIDQQQAAQLPDEQTQLMQYLQQQQAPQIPMPAADYQALFNQYGQKQQEALAQEQIGIDQLKQYQRQLQNQNGSAQDWVLPLAAIGESLGGPKTVEALRASGIETPQERKKNIIALQEKIQEYQNKATKGNLEALKTQLESYRKSQLTPLDNELKNAKIGFYNSGNREKLQTERQDFQAHSGVVNKLMNDKQLGQRLSQTNNMQNSLDIINKADVITPQQIHEFQQAIRANLGIKGTSGVGEREETYIKTLGMNAANVKQFLSGDPQNVANSPVLLKHFKELAGIEQKNISNQSKKRMDALTAGHESVYKRNPTLKKDLDEAVKNVGAQFETGGQHAGEVPQVGESVDGYMFKGGDPADPNNWEQ